MRDETISGGDDTLRWTFRATDEVVRVVIHRSGERVGAIELDPEVAARFFTDGYFASTAPRGRWSGAVHRWVRRVSM